MRSAEPAQLAGHRATAVEEGQVDTSRVLRADPAEDRTESLLVSGHRSVERRVPVCWRAEHAGSPPERHDADEAPTAADRQNSQLPPSEGIHPGAEPAGPEKGRDVGLAGELIPCLGNRCDLGVNLKLRGHSRRGSRYSSPPGQAVTVARGSRM
jgi:hypothetical protein